MTEYELSKVDEDKIKHVKYALNGFFSLHKVDRLFITDIVSKFHLLLQKPIVVTILKKEDPGFTLYFCSIRECV